MGEERKDDVKQGGFESPRVEEQSRREFRYKRVGVEASLKKKK